MILSSTLRHAKPLDWGLLACSTRPSLPNQAVWRDVLYHVMTAGREPATIHANIGDHWQ